MCKSWDLAFLQVCFIFSDLCSARVLIFSILYALHCISGIPHHSPGCFCLHGLCYEWWELSLTNTCRFFSWSAGKICLLNTCTFFTRLSVTAYVESDMINWVCGSSRFSWTSARAKQANLGCLGCSKFLIFSVNAKQANLGYLIFPNNKSTSNMGYKITILEPEL